MSDSFFTQLVVIGTASAIGLGILSTPIFENPGVNTKQIVSNSQLSFREQIRQNRFFSKLNNTSKLPILNRLSKTDKEKIFTQLSSAQKGECSKYSPQLKRYYLRKCSISPL